MADKKETKVKKEPRLRVVVFFETAEEFDKIMKFEALRDKFHGEKKKSVRLRIFRAGMQQIIKPEKK